MIPLFFHGSVITHERMLDIAAHCEKSFRLPNGDWKVKVTWFSRSGYSLGIRETIRIRKAQIRFWYRFALPEQK